MLLYLTSGDAYTGVRSLVITVTDQADAVVDLTSVALTFVVYQANGDTVFTKTLSDGITIANQTTDKGVAYIAVEELDTSALSGRYLWELEGQDSEGASTLAGGAVYIKTDLIVGGS
jgi:hypothetical protein